MYSQFYFSPAREAFRDKIRVRKFIHIMIYRRQIYLRGGGGGGGGGGVGVVGRELLIRPFRLAI